MTSRERKRKSIPNRLHSPVSKEAKSAEFMKKTGTSKIFCDFSGPKPEITYLSDYDIFEPDISKMFPEVKVCEKQIRNVHRDFQEIEIPRNNFHSSKIAPVNEIARNTGRHVTLQNKGHCLFDLKSVDEWKTCYVPLERIDKKNLAEVSSRRTYYSQKNGSGSKATYTSLNQHDKGSGLFDIKSDHKLKSCYVPLKRIERNKLAKGNVKRTNGSNKVVCFSSEKKEDRKSAADALGIMLSKSFDNGGFHSEMVNASYSENQNSTETFACMSKIYENLKNTVKSSGETVKLFHEGNVSYIEQPCFPKASSCSNVQLNNCRNGQNKEAFDKIGNGCKAGEKTLGDSDFSAKPKAVQSPNILNTRDTIRPAALEHVNHEGNGSIASQSFLQKASSSSNVELNNCRNGQNKEAFDKVGNGCKADEKTLGNSDFSAKPKAVQSPNILNTRDTIRPAALEHVNNEGNGSIAAQSFLQQAASRSNVQLNNFRNSNPTALPSSSILNIRRTFRPFTLEHAIHVDNGSIAAQAFLQHAALCNRLQRLDHNDPEFLSNQNSGVQVVEMIKCEDFYLALIHPKIRYTQLFNIARQMMSVNYRSAENEDNGQHIAARRFGNVCFSCIAFVRKELALSQNSANENEQGQHIETNNSGGDGKSKRIDASCICGKCFKSDLEFYNHRCSFKKFFGFFCVYCDLTIWKLDDFIQHSAMHFVWKKFNCSLCAVEQSIVYEYIFHMKIYHSGSVLRYPKFSFKRVSFDSEWDEDEYIKCSITCTCYVCFQKLTTKCQVNHI